MAVTNDLSLARPGPALAAAPAASQSRMASKIEFMRRKLNGERPGNDLLRRQFTLEQDALNERIDREVGSSTRALRDVATSLQGFSGEMAEQNWSDAISQESGHLRASVAELHEVNQELREKLDKSQGQFVAQKQQKAVLQQSLQDLAAQKKAPPPTVIIQNQAKVDEFGRAVCKYAAGFPQKS